MVTGRQQRLLALSASSLYYTYMWDLCLSLAIFGDLHAYHTYTHTHPHTCPGRNENIMLHFIKERLTQTHSHILECFTAT